MSRLLARLHADRERRVRELHRDLAVARGRLQQERARHGLLLQDREGIDAEIRQRLLRRDWTQSPLDQVARRLDHALDSAGRRLADRERQEQHAAAEVRAARVQSQVTARLLERREEERRRIERRRNHHRLEEAARQRWMRQGERA